MSIFESTMSCTGLKTSVESQSAGWLETISETLPDEAETGPRAAMSTTPTTVTQAVLQATILPRHSGQE